MIVKIAGWLYIVQAALALLSMAGMPYFGRGDQLLSLLLSVGIGAIGVGLLKQLSWARWFALGTSLLGWTLGALLLLVSIGLAIFAFAAARELLSAGLIIGFVLFFFVAALAVGVFVNFKLFMHLISPQGKEEFGAPEGSSLATVVASCAVWICASALTVGTSSAGSLMSAALLQGMGSKDESPRESSRSERMRAEREEARLAQQRENERIQAIQEAERLETERNASYDERIRAAEISERQRATEAVAEQQISNDTAGEDEEKSANKILKCQDPSGAVSYTQGYCPPGTRQVAAPKFE